MADISDAKETQSNPNTGSTCEILKQNTSKIIKKLELQIPSTIQLYSDLYSSYLHSLDDFFGTCYLSEKEFFDKLGSDTKSLQVFKDTSDEITKNIERQIEIMNNLHRSFLEMRTQWMKMFEQNTHLLMESYSKFLSIVNIDPKKD